jgi:hypothetical protein
MMMMMTTTKSMLLLLLQADEIWTMAKFLVYGLANEVRHTLERTPLVFTTYVRCGRFFVSMAMECDAGGGAAGDKRVCSALQTVKKPSVPQVSADVHLQ